MSYQDEHEIAARALKRGSVCGAIYFALGFVLALLTVGMKGVLVNALLWVFGSCAAFVVLCFIALAAAELLWNRDDSGMGAMRFLQTAFAAFFVQAALWLLATAAVWVPACIVVGALFWLVRRLGYSVRGAGRGAKKQRDHNT